MTDDKAYRVLARKYRPQTFDDLYGQEVLVKTLTSAITQNKIAQAYMLTGIRGVGKTTSARIIAKALNCIGPDGKGGMTPKPCGVCPNCVAISEDRHMDVMEIDAASNTGVDNVRELIESTKYTPTSARFKVYIIDEVHMLSKQAFNALLKTLEEPPPQVKFVFATTEIRKVPLTILSRCQRFDLKRVDPETLVKNLTKIATLEKVTFEEDALMLIAKAGEGSVRDAQSLLDQAIVQAGTKGITAEDVRQMLGFSEASVMVDLSDAIFTGKLAEAISLFRGQTNRGLEPLIFLQDFSDFIHSITIYKLSPTLLDKALLSPEMKAKIGAFATLLPLSFLQYAFQVLLKGIIEVRESAFPVQAAEMVLIRLACLTDDMPLGDKIKQAEKEGGALPPKPTAKVASSSSGSAAALATVSVPTVEPTPTPGAAIASLEDLVAMAAKNGEMLLFYHLQASIRPVKFTSGHFEFHPLKDAPPSLAATLSQKLFDWTGARWVVSVSSEEGAATLKEASDKRLSDQKKQLVYHPLVAKILELFPGAQIGNVQNLSLEDAADTPST